jgi:hypothetical protein
MDHDDESAADDNDDDDTEDNTNTINNNNHDTTTTVVAASDADRPGFAALRSATGSNTASRLNNTVRGMGGSNHFSNVHHHSGNHERCIFSRTHGESYNPQYSTSRNANRTGGGGRYNNDDRVFQQYVQHQRDHMMRR